MFEGIPNEIYTYGTQMFVTIIGIGIGVLISGEIWIPILYRLKVVSIYEYFELRYKSKFPRRLMAALFILKVNIFFNESIFGSQLRKTGGCLYCRKANNWISNCQSFFDWIIVVKFKVVKIVIEGNWSNAFDHMKHF